MKIARLVNKLTNNSCVVRIEKYHPTETLQTEKGVFMYDGELSVRIPKPEAIVVPVTDITEILVGKDFEYVC